jgi:hypothetical protein
VAELRAVPPIHGQVIHLHDPDYRPSTRTRSAQHSSALCGYLVNPPGVHLGDALRWTSRTPTAEDPRPPWRWCTNCLGHAAVLAGAADDVLRAVLNLGSCDGAAAGTPNQGGDR